MVGEGGMTATETLHLGAERAPFVMLPRWLLHSQVSDGAKVLYCVLHDLVAGREGPTRPVTRAQLADCCRVSVDTVDRRLAELIKAGAVEKQAQFETHQGQLANVYWVRLSPPAVAVRPLVDNIGNPGRTVAAPPAAPLRPPQPQGYVEPGRVGAAPREEQEVQELPPQPPRPAGGPSRSTRPIRRRSGGSSLRAVGANPRAQTDRAVAAEQAEMAARRAAELEARTAARRAAEDAARAETVRFEAEALALSAVLDEARLAAVVDRVASTLVRSPLARSPLALTRAVVTWCRDAVVDQPGPFLAAVDTILAGSQPVGALRADTSPRLTLATPPAGTVPLRVRIARLVSSHDTEAQASA